MTNTIKFSKIDDQQLKKLDFKNKVKRTVFLSRLVKIDPNSTVNIEQSKNEQSDQNEEQSDEDNEDEDPEKLIKELNSQNLNKYSLFLGSNEFRR